MSPIDICFLVVGIAVLVGSAYWAAFVKSAARYNWSQRLLRFLVPFAIGVLILLSLAPKFGVSPRLISVVGLADMAMLLAGVAARGVLKRLTEAERRRQERNNGVPNRPTWFKWWPWAGLCAVGVVIAAFMLFAVAATQTWYLSQVHVPDAQEFLTSSDDLAIKWAMGFCLVWLALCAGLGFFSRVTLARKYHEYVELCEGIEKRIEEAKRATSLTE